MTSEGPALKGATNLVLGALDHREIAFHPRAFREIYKFIAGREPSRIAIAPEANVRLSGLVTGTPGGVVTNRPVSGATVEIYRVSPDTGERIGGPIHSSQTGADGRWGPAQVEPTWSLEIVLTSAGLADDALSIARRSRVPPTSCICAPRVRSGPADAGAGAVVLMSRPRGYFGLPRDVVLIDGKEPKDVKSGVPTDSVTTLRLPAEEVGRSVVAMFNTERIVARAWPVVGEPHCGRRADLLAVSRADAPSWRPDRRPRFGSSPHERSDMRGFGTIPDIASLIRATRVAPMSIAEAYDMPAARAPLVPPSPPRAPDDMTFVRADEGDPHQPDRKLGPARL